MNGAKSAGFHVRDLIGLSDNNGETLLGRSSSSLDESSPRRRVASGADIDVSGSSPTLFQGSSMPEITDLSQSMAVMTSSYDHHDNPYARWLSSQDGAMSYYSGK